MRKKKKRDGTVIGIYVDRDLYKMVVESAGRDDRSINAQVRMMIRVYLESQKKNGDEA